MGEEEERTLFFSTEHISPEVAASFDAAHVRIITGGKLAHREPRNIAELDAQIAQAAEMVAKVRATASDDAHPDQKMARLLLLRLDSAAAEMRDHLSETLWGTLPKTDA